MTNDNKLAHWDLSNIYPGLESPEFETAYQDAIRLIDELEQYLDRHQIRRGENSASIDLPVLKTRISGLVDQLNRSYKLIHTLNNYLTCYISTDSFNTLAARQYSMVQAQLVRLLQAEKVIAGWLGSLGSALEEIITELPEAKAHAFYLAESADQSSYLMSDTEEHLANQLSLSSLRAWGSLQRKITSQMSIELKVNGDTRTYPLPALQNIRRYTSDPGIRQRAFEAEIKALESVKEPLAACLNGVSGYNNVVNQARHREDAIHDSLDTARIDRETLEAMLSAMQAYYPAFRGYLHKKAERLGKKALPWWDLFAPIGQNKRRYTWPQAREFVLENFSRYSTDLASFAERAFENNWIDAEPREGKRGGAFCIRIPATEESRVLCNFDGSLDQVSTIAHELGHAYHIECQRGKNYLQYITPMTLAETASIFCETIIMDAALENAGTPQEELAILESILINDTQVIVDISSRYLFEKEVYERRRESELSADEFCEIMTHAQIATYGDGLDQENMHPYMWAWKPHYYRSDIAFYNYPYAFGLLFSNGLYAIYKQRGQEFVPLLQDLLASTGQADVDELASRFGIDICSIEFWENSLQRIETRIARYNEL